MRSDEPAQDLYRECGDRGVSRMDDESARWVRTLSAAPDQRDVAVGELHALLLRVARAEAARRSGTNGVQGPELSDVAHQAVADAVVSILGKLDDFRGESRFTTWACKFVVLEVSSKLARHAWRRDRIQLEADAWAQLPARLGSGPEDVAESAELIEAVRAGVAAVLTPHQQRVFASIIVEAVPLDVLVVELGSNRNAIYKTLFDARRKLRAYLVAEGKLAGEGARTA